MRVGPIMLPHSCLLIGSNVWPGKCTSKLVFTICVGGGKARGGCCILCVGASFHIFLHHLPLNKPISGQSLQPKHMGLAVDTKGHVSRRKRHYILFILRSHEIRKKLTSAFRTTTVNLIAECAHKPDTFIGLKCQIFKNCHSFKFTRSLEGRNRTQPMTVFSRINVMY